MTSWPHWSSARSPLAITKCIHSTLHEPLASELRFLVDTQLPAALARQLGDGGHDAIHVSALPAGNRSTDTEITVTADEQDRVVVTKDRDFRNSHLLSGAPRSLLIVATGNIPNRELLALFRTHIDSIVDLLDRAGFVELSHDRLIAHSPRGN